MVLTKAPIELNRGGRLIVKSDVAGAPTDAEYIASFPLPVGITPTDGIAVVNITDNIVYVREGGAWRAVLPKILTSGAIIFSTTSAAQVSTGFGFQVAAPPSGKILLMATFNLTNAGAALSIFNFYQSTVGIPNGNVVPPGGDVILGPSWDADNLSGGQRPVTAILLATGLVPGTTYYFYVTLQTTNGSFAATINSGALVGVLSG